MNGRWALAGAAAGLACGLVAFAPAAWLGNAVSAASGGQVQLLDPRGTVWQGSAQMVLSAGEGGTGATALPGRLEWTLALRPRSVQLRLLADCCTPAPLVLDFQPAWRGWAIAAGDGNSHWPAALLVGLGAPWNTVQVQGQLHFSTQSLSVESVEGRIRLAGSAQLDALDMSSRLSTLKPIGSYRLRLAGNVQNTPPSLLLETLEGSLRLSGVGQWTGSGWRFQGEASAAPERETALGNLLNMVGRREGAKSVITLG